MLIISREAGEEQLKDVSHTMRMHIHDLHNKYIHNLSLPLFNGCSMHCKVDFFVFVLLIKTFLLNQNSVWLKYVCEVGYMLLNRLQNVYLKMPVGWTFGAWIDDPLELSWLISCLDFFISRGPLYGMNACISKLGHIMWFSYHAILSEGLMLQEEALAWMCVPVHAPSFA